MTMFVIGMILVLVAGTFVRGIDDSYGHRNREIEHVVEGCAGGLFLLLWIGTSLSFAQAWLTMSIILCAIAIPTTIYLKKEQVESEHELAFSEFLHSFSALLSKVYSYGELTGDDIRAIKGVFKKLELTESQVDFCVDTFRQCENEDWELDELLRDAEAAFDKEVLETLYELLWDVVSQSPEVSEEKLDVLKTAERMLYLPLGTFERCRQEFLSGGRASDEDDSNAGLCLEQAYQELGCTGGESSEELKSRYREMAKQYHPDILISKGLPKELMDVARRKIVRINEAWEIVKRERQIA